MEEFDLDAQPAVRQQSASLASGGFLTSARKVVLLGPPDTGKTRPAGLGIAAAHQGHRVLFATATEWVTRLTHADRAGRLPKSSPGCAVTGRSSSTRSATCKPKPQG